MGVTWKEEGSKPQRTVIERMFEDARERGELPPRVILFRRMVSGKRHGREPNARPWPLALVVRVAKWHDVYVAELITPEGQAFLYAVDDDLAAELDELMAAEPK
jgi:hypothetical protein